MAQLVRAPPCHGGGRGFESHSGRLQETLSVDCLIKLSWDHSSAGRASALQAEGHRFEPYSGSLIECDVHEVQNVILKFISGSMVKRLRHRPFTAVTGVQIPLESLPLRKQLNLVP